MTSITVYLKNMAGDLLAMEADPTWREEELLARICALDPGMYPPSRTKILRPCPDPGLLEAEETLLVWVEAGPFVESWEEDGNEKLRFVIPFEGGLIHIRRIFLFRTWVRFHAEIYDPLPSTAPYVHPHPTLYGAICSVWPGVTPSDMREIYSVVEGYLEKESVKKGMIYYYEYSQEELVECECGIVCRRSELPRHERSSEHQERLL